MHPDHLTEPVSGHGTGINADGTPVSRQWVSAQLAASIRGLVEDDRTLGRLGEQAFDARAGLLDGLVDFDGRTGRLRLNPSTRAPVRQAAGLPMTVTGKVQKFRMREMAIAELGYT
ncbi:MAG TPA: hypothetical protein VKV73_17050 [Chloroflexota bacterium]|nr:hypothetical protein [Chloroflexota bacterium]